MRHLNKNSGSIQRVRLGLPRCLRQNASEYGEKGTDCSIKLNSLSYCFLRPCNGFTGLLSCLLAKYAYKVFWGQVFCLMKGLKSQFNGFLDSGTRVLTSAKTLPLHVAKSLIVFSTQQQYTGVLVEKRSLYNACIRSVCNPYVLISMLVLPGSIK